MNLIFFSAALQRLLVSFSVPRNNYKIAFQENEVDGKELRFLHAIKFFTCHLVVVGHVLVMSVVYPAINPEYYETVVHRKSLIS